MQQNNSWNNQNKEPDNRVGARSLSRDQTKTGREKLVMGLGEGDVDQLIALLNKARSEAKDGVFLVIYPSKSEKTGKEYAKIDAYAAKSNGKSFVPKAPGTFVTNSSQAVAPTIQRQQTGYTPRR